MLELIDHKVLIADYAFDQIGVTSTISMTLSNGPQMPLKQFVLTLMNPSYASAQSAVAAALQKL
jgi:hypothetical protein